MAVLGDELFVLFNGRVENHVEVFRATTSTHELLRRITVPGLQRNDAEDLAACRRNNCLYVADSGRNCVHRLSPTIADRWPSSVRKWKVPGEPCGLSVTPDGNLVVVCRGKVSRLMLLSAGDGKLIMREIKLSSDITGAFQAVMLASGQFLICQHGLPGLYQVDSDGTVTQTYRGAGRTRLKCPCHVTIDADDDHVFVADHDHHRVAMLSLSSSLRFVSDVIELSLPSRLCADYVTGRLYVGHGCDVTVIQP